MPRSSQAMTHFEKATTAYLRNLEITGASPQTVQNYSQRLDAFTNFMWNNGYTLQGPSFVVVQAWRDSLRESGLKLTSISQYLVELRAFFAWASDPEMGEHRWYESNPVVKSLMPDTRKAEKRPYDALLTDQQVMQLWRNNPVRTNRPEFWPRNYAIIILLLTTDIRNAELLDLTPGDLDFENAELVINHGKGDKYRVVPFPPLAQTAVKLYLNSGLRPENLPADAPLFGTMGEVSNRREWGRGTRIWLTNLVERHVKAVTGVSSIRSHDLRHVGARIDLNSGMTLEELQSKLGHESMNTTQRYSGKLCSRRGRDSAKKVLLEQDIQARRNSEMLKGA